MEQRNVAILSTQSEQTIGSKLRGGILPPTNETLSASTCTAFMTLFQILQFANDSKKATYSFTTTKLPASETQILLLLQEWWTREDDPELDQLIKPSLMSYALFNEHNSTLRHIIEQLMPPSDVGTWQRARNDMEDRQSPHYLQVVRGIERIARTKDDTLGLQHVIKGTSYYHYAMLRIFDWELRRDFREPGAPLFLRKASQLAAAFRVGIACLRHGTERVEICRDSPPRGQESRKQIRQCIQGLPAIPDPCHWLSESIAADKSLPRFLWDIKNEKTIDTDTLSGLRIPVSYAIMSHTWGRWRVAGEGAKLPGVSLWLVPRNTIFSVERLPRLLQEVGFQEDYVWVDLLCIPQDSDDRGLAGICQQELARQAAIFQNASTAVVWLSDVGSWQDATWNIRWLCLTFLKDGSPGGYADQMKVAAGEGLERLENPGATSSGFRSRGHGKEAGYNPNREGNSLPKWASSLWTLQEVMMRPNMIILNKNLEPLTVGQNLAVTMDMLLAIVDVVYFDEEWRKIILESQHVDQQNEEGSDSGMQDYQEILWEVTNDFEIAGLETLEAPDSVVELADMLHSCELTDILAADCLTPLVLGRIRQATHSRAEALMAVTGATDWHLGRSVQQFVASTLTDDNSTKEKLMLELYPFEFIQEVRKKAGALMFSYQHEVSTMVVDCHQKFFDPGFRGTMLPFMTGSTGAYSILASTAVNITGLVDHPSTATWMLQVDGSVHIPQVAILVSSSEPLDRTGGEISLLADIAGNDPLTGLRLASQIKGDLLDHLRCFQGEAYAICLMNSVDECGSEFCSIGIILERAKKGEGSFVKAGTFSVLGFQEKGFEHRVLESKNVDWTVL
ncbi:HET domain-containing protein [Microdochium nivale]|nr:HET domain-containing protein [Microdochium nivale]